MFYIMLSVPDSSVSPLMFLIFLDDVIFPYLLSDSFLSYTYTHTHLYTLQTVTPKN